MPRAVEQELIEHPSAVMARVRVLCLDIEGGHGGSSRSLCELLRFIDRSRISPEVWCRQEGPVQDIYRELDIPCRITPKMPTISSLPRLSRNLYAYGRYFGQFLGARSYRNLLVDEINNRFDLVHFNHEGLFLLARWMRGRVRVPFTMHIRTNLRDTVFARWQNRVTAKTVQHLIYITENERITLERQSGFKTNGTVIFNVAMPPKNAVSENLHIPDKGRFKVGCVANYSWDKGLDRLIDVAKALALSGLRERILFVFAGDMTLARSLPGELGRIGAAGGTLADYADSRGVGDMFCWLGHVSNPESVLASCDILAKPTRHNNPWGRDIVEALAAGKPVLSVGTWNTIVETHKTGILFPRYNTEEFAHAISELMANPVLLRNMGKAGRARMARLCNGPDRAADVAAVWESVARNE